MTGADDNFLARWSRRKQDVKASEAAEGAGAARPPEQRSESSPPCGERVAPQGLGEGDSAILPGEEDPSSGSSPHGGGEPRPAPLPRIEDLTAESDITGFLRAGVPEALKTAALRKAWSLDPAIRDYVGPSEYAHDFNNPATIPGFGAGPGWDADTAAEYAQKIVNPSGAENLEPPVSSVTDRVAQPELNPLRLDADTGPPAGRIVKTPAPTTEAPDPAPARQESPAGEESWPDPPASGPTPRHGGATPR